MKFEIKSGRSSRVIFETEIECEATVSEGIKLGLAVKAAYKSGSNLCGADLRYADLRSFKADLWMTLMHNRDEAAGVVAALRAGKVDGSTYSGDCACLVGTIANIRGVTVDALDKGPSRPAEQWFAMIRAGDKPGDDTGGGFAAQKALEWTLEWCALCSGSPGNPTEPERSPNIAENSL